MRWVFLMLLLVWPGVALGEELAADPVAVRLVTYLRALTPGAVGAGEILDVMEADAEWPQAGVLARRYADALTAERDDRVVDGLCQRRSPGTALRCCGVRESRRMVRSWRGGLGWSGSPNRAGKRGS